MKNKHPYRFFILVSLTFILGCQTQNTEEQALNESEDSPQAQAVLLVQPTEFNAEEKNKITGEYDAVSELTVPRNLQPQNKWVMFEGPVLENDLIAYRFYLDSRHRSDIYGKKTHDLVMDTVGWNYHEIMDWGSDILKVNQSLGIGSPAIWYQDSIYTLSNCAEKTVTLEQDGQQATVRTTFTGLTVGDQTFDLVQNWSIQSGQAWTTINLEVVNGSLPDGMRFATGYVKHLEDNQSGETNDQLYAYNWGVQSFHDENMGMGLIMDQSFQPTYTPDIWSHVYIFENAAKSVNYRFLAAWEQDVIGVRSAADFKQLIVEACQQTD